jgi:hypothetical protein
MTHGSGRGAGFFSDNGFHRVPGDGDVSAEKAWELDPPGRSPDRIARAHIEVEAKQVCVDPCRNADAVAGIVVVFADVFDVHVGCVQYQGVVDADGCCGADHGS